MTARMDLQTFLPYRLAVLSEQVSQCVALVYRERFGLSRDAWRVLAALADGGTVRTADVIAATALEKMQVSRAVAAIGIPSTSPPNGSSSTSWAWMLISTSVR